MLGEVSIIDMEYSNKYSTQDLKIEAKLIVHKFVYEVMGFCSCGRAENILIKIRDVLQVVHNKYIKRHQEKSSYSLKRIQDEYEEEMREVIYDDIIQELVLQILTSYGLLEHTKCIHNSTLTPYGEEILCALNILYKRR